MGLHPRNESRVGYDKTNITHVGLGLRSAILAHFRHLTAVLASKYE